MKYKLIKDYSGGGTILNDGTSPDNLRLSCNDDIYDEVKQLIESGHEVIILKGKIQAIQGASDDGWR